MLTICALIIAAQFAAIFCLARSCRANAEAAEANAEALDIIAADMRRTADQRARAFVADIHRAPLHKPRLAPRRGTHARLMRAA